MDNTLIIILTLYFLPSLIAVYRKHQDWLAICMVNLFLGWTIIGWFRALFWSGTAPRFKVSTIIE